MVKKAEELKEEIIDDVQNLESLITEGINAKIPLQVKLPNGTKGNVLIAPITNGVFNRLVKQSRQNNRSLDLLVAEKGTFTLNEEKFPNDKLEMLPAGVVSDIAREIGKISGITKKEDEDKDKDKMMDKLLGF